MTHLSTHDVEGGAARAAYRLHRNLIDAGCDSRMIVRHKGSDDCRVQALSKPLEWPARLRRRARRWHLRAASARLRRRLPAWVEYFGDDRSDLAAQLLAQLPESDIINLHWVISLLDYEQCLPDLARRAPLVWRLPDLHAVTGGCVYAGDCRRFTTHCGTCPQLGSRQMRDPAFASFERKARSYSQIAPERLHFVALTRWMAEQIAASALGSRFPVSVIPNSIDHQRFAPQDAASARAEFGLPADVPIVLFIAHDPLSRRKGMAELLGAIGRIPQSLRPVLVTIGSRAPEVAVTGHYHLGMISDDERLVLAYNAATLVAVPSLEENLPNTALEAIACGVPVVGFEVGGVPDIVRPSETGFLAPPGDEEALASGMLRILDDSALRAQLARQCRDVAIREFGRATQASRYLDLYHSMLQA